MMRKARWFWPLALTLLVADCASKRLVESRLAVGESHPLVGNVVRFTLSYNTNAAMGIQLGGNERRLVLSLLTIAALGVLAFLYRRTLASERAPRYQRHAYHAQ